MTLTSRACAGPQNKKGGKGQAGPPTPQDRPLARLIPFVPTAVALAKQQQAQVGKNKEALAKEKERDAKEKEKLAEAKRKAEMNDLFKPVQVQQKVRREGSLDQTP